MQRREWMQAMIGIGPAMVTPRTADGEVSSSISTLYNKRQNYVPPNARLPSTIILERNCWDLPRCKQCETNVAALAWCSIIGGGGAELLVGFSSGCMRHTRSFRCGFHILNLLLHNIFYFKYIIFFLPTETCRLKLKPFQCWSKSSSRLARKVSTLLARPELDSRWPWLSESLWLKRRLKLLMASVESPQPLRCSLTRGHWWGAPTSIIRGVGAPHQCPLGVR